MPKITIHMLLLGALVVSGSSVSQVRAAIAAEGPPWRNPPNSSFFRPAGTDKVFHYYYNDAGASVATALIAVHGLLHDVCTTFHAALTSLQRESADGATLVIAPLFRNPEKDGGVNKDCMNPPDFFPDTDDLVWTKDTWSDGEPADGPNKTPNYTSFAAMGGLVDELVNKWPNLKKITIAGFSEGAQLVQRYIGFAAPRLPAGVTIRYVVADPGSWLYFDTFRPVEPIPAGASNFNDWKYGTGNLPSWLARTARDARDQYSKADIGYLEGGNDTST
jgi:hypothetical protein